MFPLVFVPPRSSLIPLDKYCDICAQHVIAEGGRRVVEGPGHYVDWDVYLLKVDEDLAVVLLNGEGFTLGSFCVEENLDLEGQVYF